LDIPPADNRGPVQAGRIWCERGTDITAEFKPDTAGWTAGAGVSVECVDPRGRVLASLQSSMKSPVAKIHAVANQAGWFAWRVTGSALPASGAPYELTVTYTATQGLTI
jgi:hypothetical protein